MFRQDGVPSTAVGLRIRPSDKVQCNYASDRKVIIYTRAEETNNSVPFREEATTLIIQSLFLLVDLFIYFYLGLS